MLYYRQADNYEPPYKVLVDGSFLHKALKMGIKLKTSILTKILDNNMELCITQCTLNELGRIESARDTFTAASFIKRIDCGDRHSGTVECICSVLGDDNPDKYITVTQDEALKQII